MKINAKYKSLGSLALKKEDSKYAIRAASTGTTICVNLFLAMWYRSIHQKEVGREE